ncbi:MAG: pyruvate ferredoxin oxidoreductase [candidate division Zixibacteria bacterium]|nr:pyruvate ferredoxin oxidoreductase [candidate division Zixibacteria bacterium]
MAEQAVKKKKKTKPPVTESLLAPGHRACAGCGEALGAKLVMDAAGPNTYVTTCTGCLEVFSTPYPESAWKMPWIHSLFENSSAVAAGIEAALIAQGRDKDVNIIAQGGDGGTADIGIGCLSGMLERGHNILYVCYDNEAYMNTGVQRSGLTPFDARTSTTPVGKRSMGNQTNKKNLPEIAAAHGIPYSATATVGYPNDVIRKVQKALKIKGPKFLQIHVPCPLGWIHPTDQTIEVAKLAVLTGLIPIFEMEDGKLTRVRKIGKNRKPVEEYLKAQGRFRHLFKGTPEAEAELEKVRQIAEANIEKYGLA